MSYGKGSLPSREEMIANKLRRVHVLVLDSSPHVTQLFKSMLKEFGFTQIFIGHNGYEGVRIMREIRINLIVTDWELKLSKDVASVQTGEEFEPLSGVHFVRRLRQSPKSPNPFIPIIMLADGVERMDIVSARDSGVNEILLKPLNARDLAERIKSVIDKPRMFITADHYKGPCRRLKQADVLPVPEDRRKTEIRIIRNNEKSKSSS